MSLAVPYLLDAAARTVPEADVAVADDHMTVSELDRRSIAAAEALLQKVCRPAIECHCRPWGPPAG